MKLPIALAILLSYPLLVSGCGGSASSPPSLVGNMSDTSYNGQRGKVRRPNARGRMVGLEGFAGKFIWADYAAPWCGPCVSQTQNLKSVESSFGNGVVFLTIMTSEMGGYGHPATSKTAAGWAKRFGLNPARVLAANLTSMRIPRNILYSPDGQVLLDETGMLPAGNIQSKLRRYMKDWRNWKRTGKLAKWMY